MKAADALFDILSEIAARGERCPQRTDLDRLLAIRVKTPLRGITAQSLLSELARAGKIVVKVHAKNWRTIDILEGPCAGMSTMPPPKPWAVYMIADRDGYHRVEA